MDLKKKISRFFHQTRRGNGGFTLVELIVVIAILAILGGVAVPVYNGYIEKANQAADDTLIAAINRAAAAAVLEANGDDMGGLQNGELVSNASKGSAKPIIVERKNARMAAEEAAAVKTAFEKFFAGNETAALKWYGYLKFSNGAFVGVGSMMNGDLKTPEDSNVVDAWKASSYDNLGVEGVTTMVNDLAGALADFAGAESLYETEKFQAVLAELGIDPATANEQTLANAAVFYLAKCTSELGEELGVDVLWSHVTNNSLQDYLRNNGYEQKDAVFIDTALQYAAATAFAYSDYGNEAMQEILTNTPTDKSSALTNIGNITSSNVGLWTIYCAKEDSASDFNAFYEVMETVIYNTDTFTTFEGDSLFANPELQEAMNKLLGTTN